MKAAKLSISLPAESARFIERYRKEHRLSSTSRVVDLAVKALRERSLVEAYRAAAEETAEEAKVWDVTAGDGLPDETW
jgi:Arc/MetJ-type ribon-helix-helix transcriptional regulator